MPHSFLYSKLDLLVLFPQKTQIKTLRGFDRLAAAGFSEEDIAQFRRTFHSQNEGDYIESEDIDGDDDCKYILISLEMST